MRWISSWLLFEQSLCKDFCCLLAQDIWVARAYSECCILSFTFEIHEGSMRVMVTDGRDKTATLNILNGYSNSISLGSLAWKLEAYLTLLLHTCFKYIISCFESCELKLTLVYGFDTLSITLFCAYNATIWNRVKKLKCHRFLSKLIPHLDSRRPFSSRG
ncbi:hypothetical protein Hanom_Chr10g00872461 [Helianthus anomalus]